MNDLWEVPNAAVVSLTPERAVTVIRAIFRSECGYARLGPSALTISDRIMAPDGGIDAEVKVPHEHVVPVDCIFQPGITGFQIKSGISFKPWTSGSIRGELLNGKGELCSEVKRLIQRKGHYSIICTGHDLTPEQRNDAIALIMEVLGENGFEEYEGKIDVLGARQIAEFSERYPGTASLLTADPVQEALTLEEWRHDAHMENSFEESPEQAAVISKIRANIQGETKHTRILGEAGLGKTRLALESLKDHSTSPYVLYIQHGSEFGQTKLFRQLLKRSHEKPLILVIDELPESDLSDIWRHLKSRCGYLKIISMDHGRDETRDEEIERINVPYLPDDTIKRILAYRIGESPDLDRWVRICEGSPRVAQAVADNLYANPSDLLKPPSIIPIWSRFLHGYGNRNETSARQIDCVAQHLALFSRFGFEDPVGKEAAYIAELVRNSDPTIGWAQFQEVVKEFRARRVLQGSRTLFFVPKALHIYLWKQFWECYGHDFDFKEVLLTIPDSLHVWFMSMFKYAGQTATTHVINDVLKLDGIFSRKENLISEKGSMFLSVLCEANPGAVLRLLERSFGAWTDEEIFNLSENRQNFVWTLEKIAVWPIYTVRAMKILIRLAVHENSHYSNNSTGTLLGLYRIGPEWAATESSPEERLPAFLMLLRAQSDAERRLGLEAADAALETQGIGFRIVGPEYQGLRERAKLWTPRTYDDWWHAHFVYFESLVNETERWPSNLRSEVCNSLLNAVEQQLQTPTCTELAFRVLDILVNDNAMQPKKLNRFFWNWREYKDNGKNPETKNRLRIIERRYTKRSLVSRFSRYVLDVEWTQWDEERRERKGKPRTRSKALVKALSRRIARTPDSFDEIRQHLTPEKGAPGLWFFGEQLAKNDPNRIFLPQLIDVSLKTNHQTCLYGYLSGVKDSNSDLYTATIDSLLNSQNTAWLGADIALSSDYDDDLFLKCLSLLDKSWIAPEQFNSLRFGKKIDYVPKERLLALFHQLRENQSETSLYLLLELLNSISFDKFSPFNSKFVFEVVSECLPREDSWDVMRGYHWKVVSQKLIHWDERYALPLLDVLLTKMNESYRLSYDHDVEPLANELVQTDPSGAWGVIKVHFEESLPKWRSDLLHWLKGGVGGFEEDEKRGAIADLPIQEILEWVEKNPEQRAGLIAHAAPSTLDDIDGGKVTRELLYKYGQIDGVKSGISSNFSSGGWVGPASAYLKRKREKFRRWLSAGFEFEVSQWIESEIECLDRCIEREEINEERSRFD